MNKNTSTLARSDDGTIQITFRIPKEVVKKTREETLDEISKEIEIPGFRKGKAPQDLVASKISPNSVIEKTLSKILPKLLNETVSEHKIKSVIYPKFELIKANEDEDWEVRAVTCELPDLNLGDYKKAIVGISKENKEQAILKTLLETIKINIPKILIDQEVDRRLSSLLERIEKLGLTLESYIASIGRSTQTLRGEYENQVRESLSIELILNKIAEEENIKADEAEINRAISALSADPNIGDKASSPNQRRLIEGVLKRKGALEKLASL